MDNNKNTFFGLQELYKVGLNLLEAQKMVEEKLKPLGSPFIVVSLPDALKVMETNGAAILEAVKALRSIAEAKAGEGEARVKDLFDKLQESFNLN